MVNWHDIQRFADELRNRLAVSDINDTKALATLNDTLFVLDMMADLAKEDDVDGSIAKKINEFFGEVLMNFAVGFAENHKTVQSCLTVPLGKIFEETTEKEGELAPCQTGA